MLDMITQIILVAIGNALKIMLAPLSTAESWRLLRNTTGTFVDQNDASSSVIYNGQDQTFIVDATNLLNGTSYFYCLFCFDGTNWTASPVVSATPTANYIDKSVDALTVLRDRLDVGLQNEVAAGFLSPSSGVISVLNAPPIFEETNWPVVTVHVSSDGSGDRAIGEMIYTDEFDVGTGLWDESEGWLANVQLMIVGWSQNPDERMELRKSLRKIIIGNLGVFDSFGIVNIDFSQQDVDELQSYPAPVYQSVGTFSCKAPAIVSDSLSVITSVQSPTVTVL